MFQALGNLGRFRAANLKVNYRLDDVNGLAELVDKYSLFPLDRDCTLQGYHAKERVKEFEDVLWLIAPKGEIVSNSSFDELRRIRDIYGDMMPVSKLVRFTDGYEKPFLIRFEPDLKVYRYDAPDLVDVTSACELEHECGNKISYEYRKPYPLILHAVLDMNRQIGRLPPDGKSLMVGDRWLTDIIAGNLAGIDTAIVKPHEPFSDTPFLILSRYTVEKVAGWMSSDR
jgi:ribonucleotide monophosphatase NagD (HAD superfamily)